MTDGSSRCPPGASPPPPARRCAPPASPPAARERLLSPTGIDLRACAARALLRRRGCSARACGRGGGALGVAPRARGDRRTKDRIRVRGSRERRPPHSAMGRPRAACAQGQASRLPGGGSARAQAVAQRGGLRRGQGADARRRSGAAGEAARTRQLRQGAAGTRRGAGAGQFARWGGDATCLPPSGGAIQRAGLPAAEQGVIRIKERERPPIPEAGPLWSDFFFSDERTAPAGAARRPPAATPAGRPKKARGESRQLWVRARAHGTAGRRGGTRVHADGALERGALGGILAGRQAHRQRVV